METTKPGCHEKILKPESNNETTNLGCHNLAQVNNKILVLSMSILIQICDSGFHMALWFVIYLWHPSFVVSL
jgi:hypothetical protein